MPNGKKLLEYEGDYYYGVYCHLPTRRDVELGAWPRPNSRRVALADTGLRIGEETFVPFEGDVFVESSGNRLVHFGRDASGQVTNFAYSTSPDTFEKPGQTGPYIQFESLAQAVMNLYSRRGSQVAARFLKANSDSQQYYVRESEFNTLGDLLMEREAIDLAVEVCKLNVAALPRILGCA